MGIIPTNAIEIDNVTIERGHHIVLTIDELHIPVGYTAVVGPNGSGKSTLLHAVAGLLTPRTGTIRVGGSGLGYVLQAQHASDQLLVTAREVVALARSAVRGPFGRLRAADREAIDVAMERLDVTDLAHRHIAEMSGGQRQRVFIAQGLAQEADILLLDEPVAGLDISSAQVIRRAIDDERAAGRTVVVATHDLDEAARADRVAMVNGRVIAFGTPTEVLRTEFLREAYQGRVLEIGDGLVVDDGVHHDHVH